MKKEFVRCADCEYAREMKTIDGIAVRCHILGVGKVKNARRVCGKFYPAMDSPYRVKKK